MSMAQPVEAGQPSGSAAAVSGAIAPGANAPGALPARLADAALALSAAAFESGLVFAAYHYRLPLAWILLGHGLIVAALGLWVLWRARRGRDIASALLTMIATAAIGPLGALGSAFSALASRPSRESPRLLEQWYERISHSTEVDAATKQCDMVSIGRALDLAGPAPTSFSAIMEDGTLAQKQNALGLIARKFHLDYLPALQSALKCDQPVIRVQAAAVAAHVRADLKAHLYGLIAKVPAGRGQDDSGILLLAGQIEDCLISNLLDEKDRAQGRIAADRLYDLKIGVLGLEQPEQSGGENLATAGSVYEQEKLARAYEARLLRRGDFAKFRSRRNAASRLKEPGR